MTLSSITTAILVRDTTGRVRARIDTTRCPWCGPSADYVCRACSTRAGRAKASIARTDARRAQSGAKGGAQ